MEITVKVKGLDEPGTNFFNTAIGLSPLIQTNYVSKHLTSHLTLGPTLHSFQDCYRTTMVSSSLSPLTPVHRNMAFPPDMYHSFLQMECFHNDVLAGHFFTKLEVLIQSSHSELFPFWSYMQIRNFLSTTVVLPTFFRSLTAFKSQCNRNTLQRQLV